MSEGLNCIDWGSIEALVSLAFVFFTLYMQKFCYLQQQSTNRRFPVQDQKDSSSDEERPDKSYKSRHIIHEINLQGDVRQSKAPELVTPTKKKIFTKIINRQRPLFTKHTGVRQRNWGKWAAEIQDPFQRRWLWLGTYNTPEESSQAYNTKKLELEAKKNNNQSSPAAAYLPQNHLAASWGLENVSSRASPTSVLEMEPVALASHINHECNDMVKDVGNKINVVEQQVCNLDPVDEQLNLSQIGEGLDFEMELKCLFTDDFPQLPDDLSNHDDLQTCRLKDGEPTDLPDFDFDLGDEECAWMDEPSNIAHP